MRAQLCSALWLLVSACATVARARVCLDDWCDLPSNLGWSVFNRWGQSFDPAVNLQICARHVVDIAYDASVSDYTPVLNREFNKLRARDPPGGTLRLSAGVFPVAQNVRMPSYTCLFGAGLQKTSLRLVDNASRFDQAGQVRSFQAQRITVSDLTIDGNLQNQVSRDLKHPTSYGRFGFFSELVNYVYLRRVATQNHLGYGFDPHGSKVHWSYYLLLEDCLARNNALDGFTLDQTVYVTLRDSVAIGNWRHGVNIVTGTKYCVVAGNFARDNGFNTGKGCSLMTQNSGQKLPDGSIRRFGTNHMRFVRNTLINGRKAAVCVNDVGHVALERNRMRNAERKAYCYHFVNTRALFSRGESCTPARPKGRLFERSAVYEFRKGGIGVTRVSARARTPVV